MLYGQNDWNAIGQSQTQNASFAPASSIHLPCMTPVAPSGFLQQSSN